MGVWLSLPFKSLVQFCFIKFNRFFFLEVWTFYPLTYWPFARRKLLSSFFDNETTLIYISLRSSFELFSEVVNVGNGNIGSVVKLVEVDQFSVLYTSFDNWLSS